MTDSQQSDRDEYPLEVEQQIDRLSDEFESAWRDGQTRRIEEYLEGSPNIGRQRLLEKLLAVEFDLRQQAGDTLDVESYRERFPDDRRIIDAVLVLHQRRKRGKGLSSQAPDSADDPEQIGRFQIRRRLGCGGYGVVYLAHDPGLDRFVALKVPRPELLKTGKQRENFLHEARTAAKLKHPALVMVYDVQEEGDLIYIVQEYIEGQNLAQWARSQSPSWEHITRWMIEIATAIGYVHQQGFYHRDLKPGNILIDNEGHAFVADFGLAVHEDALRMLKGKAPGTPPYMSPEQVRRETHWIDGRTDIWALGVILYELLAEKRPFTADELLDLYEEIQELDPKSPRARNPDVPKELERICFKCLAKRRTQRYATASDLLEDLEAFSETCADSGGAENVAAERSSDPVLGSATVRAAGDSTPQESTPTPDSGSEPPLRIIPKGLRSFDKEDKDFFVELLPGPRDRDGLPDSIRFWKSRIEQTDPDLTFPVGVMYGPSGCGKSSLMKAGLLPRLASHVLPIVVEVTPNDTELRLLKRLRRRVPGLATDASLAEALAQLREGFVTDGQKVLVLLDQFEQWLHATGNMDNSQLVRALRQCDGANVQCLILVRDDFWMSTTRFMQALEIPQVEHQNSAAVDLFDPSHARKVLRAFGLAYGCLPEHDLSKDEQRFLDRAVQDLVHDGKVICVQLSLFADMLKSRPWTPASLQEVGGTSGVGVAFLDETFTAKTAPPTHRLHAKAAQAVLKALLPEAGADIKGQMQSTEHLLKCSGYANRPTDFQNLLQILNAELRLITPTESEGEAMDGGSETEHDTSSAEAYYQLTHDYLVPSLRDWLTRKQKETHRGRAQLRLAERSALWNGKPENRNLPSWWEYLNIRLLTQRREWAEPQRTMMRRAGSVHAARWSIAVVVLFALSLGLQRLWSRNLDQRIDNLVTAMSTSRGIIVPRAIQDLQELPRQRVIAALKRRYQDADDGRKLPLAYAMAAHGEVECRFLVDAIPRASAEECDNIAIALALDSESARQELTTAAATATSKRDWKLKTRLATMAMYLNRTEIAAEMLRAEPPATPATKPATDPKLDPLPEWDPIQRTMFIEWFPKWAGSVEKFVPLLRACDDPAQKSGMSLAIGSITEPRDEAKKAWQELLSEWYVGEPESGTHGAAGWALRSWDLAPPPVPPRQSPLGGWNWYRTKSDLTMIRIPAGVVGGLDDRGAPQRIEVSQEFWLSDREITVRHFLEFLHDQQYEWDKPDKLEEVTRNYSGDPSLPIVGVNWYDAVKFCNWLSRQEGRSPCYEKEGKEKIRDFDGETREYDAWKLLPGANGYRLPTEQEWEYACRAKTTTLYSFGDSEELLDRYAVFAKNSKNGPDGPDTGGRMLCNAWGLFDMHGNAWEWCQDWYAEGSFRVNRGGCSGSSVSFCQSALHSGIQPSLRALNQGFRVASVPSSK